MSDGERSGRSTGRVSCKSTELKRCSMIEMRWNKYEVSLASPVWTQIRRPSSEIIIIIFCLKLWGPCTWGTLDFAHHAHPIAMPLIMSQYLRSIDLWPINQ